MPAWNVGSRPTARQAALLAGATAVGVALLVTAIVLARPGDEPPAGGLTPTPTDVQATPTGLQTATLTSTATATATRTVTATATATSTPSPAAAATSTSPATATKAPATATRTSAPPTPTPQTLPVPQLALRGIDRDYCPSGCNPAQGGDGIPWTRYDLSITNAADLPDWFLTGPYVSCDPPAVRIIDAGTNVHIYGFCGGTDDAAAMRRLLHDGIWFAVKSTLEPPRAVAVILTDTDGGAGIRSTELAVPR